MPQHSVDRVHPTWFVLFVLLAACGGDEEPMAPDTPSFSQDIQPIFTNSCAVSNCHVTPVPRGDMNLRTSVAYAQIVNVPAFELETMMRVSPGHPALSYLVHKLEGTHESVEGWGDQMPRGQPPLPTAQISLIREWITAGALRN